MGEHHHHDHDHDCQCNHDHHEHDFITLVDEEGNEALYEILLTIDGEEEFANKQYVLLYPAGIDEDDDTEVDLLAYEYIESASGTEGELKNIETDAEWDMIEEVFNTFAAEQEE
ncbi:DUF1292 domain-containing protein [Vagococcus elongatus]|uniref:UPF0473 protein CBF29_12010 n=1 Tax=Vagococcus elongatus TaxID=180344 RepID=A0A430AM87_9ENTE|nr:DUF1292 domain-containing protein [Vagococcus elongatus]RSU09186.1 hypothetical protein CBF29_12010 [Vagococcus elongatus]